MTKHIDRERTATDSAHKLELDKQEQTGIDASFQHNKLWTVRTLLYEHTASVYIPDQDEGTEGQRKPRGNVIVCDAPNCYKGSRETLRLPYRCLHMPYRYDLCAVPSSIRPGSSDENACRGQSLTS